MRGLRSDVLVRPMTREDAERVARWRYRGAWSVYDLPSAEPILDALTDHHAVVAADTLIGFCCTGDAARVPGLAVEPHMLDVGLGMDPSLVGRGQGTAFGWAVVRHLALRHPGRSMRAAVQSWNQRSLRLTQRLGFADEGVLTAGQGGRPVSYRILAAPSRPFGRHTD